MTAISISQQKPQQKGNPQYPQKKALEIAEILASKLNLTPEEELFLRRFQDKLDISTEEDNDKALEISEMLANEPNLTPEEDRILESLLDQIEKFEEEHYPLDGGSTPSSRLSFLMETNCLEETDIREVLGSPSITAKIINGEREISKDDAVKLGQRFNVEPTLFLVEN